MRGSAPAAGGHQAEHVAAYVEQLGIKGAKPTVKQHLAAIRQLFDYLVTAEFCLRTPRAPSAGPNTW